MSKSRSIKKILIGLAAVSLFGSAVSALAATAIAVPADLSGHNWSGKLVFHPANTNGSCSFDVTASLKRSTGPGYDGYFQYFNGNMTKTSTVIAQGMTVKQCTVKFSQSSVFSTLYQGKTFPLNIALNGNAANQGYTDKGFTAMITLNNGHSDIAAFASHNLIRDRLTGNGSGEYGTLTLKR